MELNKLSQVVAIEHNDSDAVILKVKDDAKMILLSTGCFKGTEDMFIISKRSKKREHLAFSIVYKDGRQFGWDQFEMVSSTLETIQKWLHESVVWDFGIPIDDKPELLEPFNNIQSLADDLNMPHTFKVVGFGPGDMIMSKEGAFMGGISYENALKYLNDRYKIVLNEHSNAPQTGCDVFLLKTECKDEAR